MLPAAGKKVNRGIFPEQATDEEDVKSARREPEFPVRASAALRSR